MNLCLATEKVYKYLHTQVYKLLPILFLYCVPDGRKVALIEEVTYVLLRLIVQRQSFLLLQMPHTSQHD